VICAQGGSILGSAFVIGGREEHHGGVSLAGGFGEGPGITTGTQGEHGRGVDPGGCEQHGGRADTGTCQGQAAAVDTRLLAHPVRGFEQILGD
jgi:hypothetical protein